MRIALASSPSVQMGVALSAILVAVAAPIVATGSSTPAANRAVGDLESICHPDAVQAIAGKTADGITVRQVPNGPHFEGGVKYVAGSAHLPAYCQVTGSFVTDATTGKTANFLATFPANWNGKYLQYGCFGMCGSLLLNDAAHPLESVIAQGLPGDALRKGYASFGTDGGHAAVEGAFARDATGRADPHALTDYAYRAARVLAVKGKVLTKAFYAAALGTPQTITYAYFDGCSDGGRDAMVAASTYPEAFDGIIAGSPAADWSGIELQMTGIALATLRSPGAQVPPAMMAKAAEIVTAQCDALDGVKDGLIQNPGACNFEPLRDLPRCSQGQASDQCFTKEQAETLSAILTAITDQHGDLVRTAYSPSDLATPLPPHRPTNLADPDPWLGDATAGYSRTGFEMMRDATPGETPLDVRGMYTFRSGGPGAITNYRVVLPSADVARARAFSAMGSATDPRQLHALIKQNRKLLIWQNLSDQLLNPYATINYYKQAARLNGGYARLQKNVRLFPVPGTLHCSMGGPGPGEFDALTAMETWVEKDHAPEALEATYYPARSPAGFDYGKPGRTMPLCKFPEMASYKGHGDVNAAANWTCAPGDTRMLKVGAAGRQAGLID
jgi:feruloyl esterase